MIFGGFAPGQYFPLAAPAETPSAPCEPWIAVGKTTASWSAVGATSYGWIPLSPLDHECSDTATATLDISGTVFQTDDFTTPTTEPSPIAHTIELRDSGQNVIDTTTCNAGTGEYSFTDLAAGTYYLSFFMVLGIHRHLVEPNVSTPNAFADGIWDNGSDPTETLYWNTVTLIDEAVTDVNFTVWVHAE